MTAARVRMHARQLADIASYRASALLLPLYTFAGLRKPKDKND